MNWPPITARGALAWEAGTYLDVHVSSLCECFSPFHPRLGNLRVFQPEAHVMITTLSVFPPHHQLYHSNVRCSGLNHHV